MMTVRGIQTVVIIPVCILSKHTRQWSLRVVPLLPANRHMKKVDTLMRISVGEFDGAVNDINVTMIYCVLY